MKYLQFFTEAIFTNVLCCLTQVTLMLQGLHLAKCKRSVLPSIRRVQKRTKASHLQQARILLLSLPLVICIRASSTSTIVYSLGGAMSSFQFFTCRCVTFCGSCFGKIRFDGEKSRVTQDFGASSST